jgi:hypothetical protein
MLRKLTSVPVLVRILYKQINYRVDFTTPDFQAIEARYNLVAFESSEGIVMNMSESPLLNVSFHSL